MKNFEEFSKSVRINESTVNRMDGETLKDVMDGILMYLEEHKINPIVVWDGEAVCTLSVGGDKYTIRQLGKNEFEMSTKVVKAEKYTQDELVDYWMTFVGEYHTELADRRREEANESKVNESTAYICATCGERAEHEEIEENPKMKCSNCGDSDWEAEH